MKVMAAPARGENPLTQGGLDGKTGHFITRREPNHRRVAGPSQKSTIRYHRVRNRIHEGETVYGEPHPFTD